jgi:hypothetical protein
MDYLAAQVFILVRWLTNVVNANVNGNLTTLYTSQVVMLAFLIHECHIILSGEVPSQAHYHILSYEMPLQMLHYMSEFILYDEGLFERHIAVMDKKWYARACATDSKNRYM